MQTIYGELCEVCALVQKNKDELVEVTSWVAVPTQDKALGAFMQMNNLQTTMIINAKISFVRYVICAM